MPAGGTKVSSGVGDGVSTVLAGVGVLRFTFAGRSGFRCAAISSNLGLTTKKNRPAKAPPPNKRRSTRAPIISGTFDFFFTTGTGSGAEGAGVETAGGGSAGGGVAATGGGGGAGGGVGVWVAWGLAMSEVFGVVPVGPVVGPVLRGSATVAG